MYSLQERLKGHLACGNKLCKAPDHTHANDAAKGPSSAAHTRKCASRNAVQAPAGASEVQSTADSHVSVTLHLLQQAAPPHSPAAGTAQIGSAATLQVAAAAAAATASPGHPGAPATAAAAAPAAPHSLPLTPHQPLCQCQLLLLQQPQPQQPPLRMLLLRLLQQQASLALWPSSAGTPAPAAAAALLEQLCTHSSTHPAPAPAAAVAP